MGFPLALIDALVTSHASIFLLHSSEVVVVTNLLDHGLLDSQAGSEKIDKGCIAQNIVEEIALDFCQALFDSHNCCLGSL